MAIATITSKGQTTIPKSVQTTLMLEAGHRVEFIETEAGFLVKPATRDIRSLKGILPKHRRVVSIEDMNRSIARIGQRTQHADLRTHPNFMYIECENAKKTEPDITRRGEPAC